MYAYVLYIGGHGILYVLNLFPFRGQGAICEYFNLCIFGRRCCVTVKMDIERTHTMPHCSLCSICGSKYNQSLVAHQLIICLSCCEVSNNVNSFLLYSHANLPELETVVSLSVAETVRTEVKWTIGVKRTTDGEGDSSESKSGAEDTLCILYYKYSAYM